MLVFVKKIWEFRTIRFIVVGSFNTLFDISLLLAIVKLFGLSSVIANSISVTIAISVSYFLNHRIVFRQKDGFLIRQYIRFFLITGIGIILIQDAVIYLVTDKLWIIDKARVATLFGQSFRLKILELLAAKLIAVVIGLFWNFTLYKYAVFKDGSIKEDRLIVG